MDALIKALRPDAKPPETRPAELDPSEFLAAAVRADQPRPWRAEAEAAGRASLANRGETPQREGVRKPPAQRRFPWLVRGPPRQSSSEFARTARFDIGKQSRHRGRADVPAQIRRI